jgi:hypothetical protein
MPDPIASSVGSAPTPHCLRYSVSAFADLAAVLLGTFRFSPEKLQQTVGMHFQITLAAAVTFFLAKFKTDAAVSKLAVWSELLKRLFHGELLKGKVNGLHML